MVNTSSSSSSSSSAGWEAIPTDLPSIGTLHARAFHAKSDWHRKVFPISLAPWWEARYALDIADPACHILRIYSPDQEPAEPCSSSATTVIGLVFIRKYTSLERGSPSWSFMSPPAHLVDLDAFNAMVSSMISYRERFMLGRPHMCVEHFGVDATYQGHGLGTKLLAKACEIADNEGLDVFVTANEFAESFYHRCGFTTEGTLKMPGGLTECFLIRRFKR